MEKYYFSRASIIANANEVANWLTENASEYFDSVTVDTATNSSVSSSYPLVVCKIGETAELAFCASNPKASTNGNASNLTTLRITTGNGYQLKTIGIYSNDEYPFTYTKYAIKTSGGIMLCMSKYFAIFITKTTAGTTAVYTKWFYYGSSGMVHSFRTVDLINSRYADTNIYNKVSSSDNTSIAPICFPSSTYSPSLFFTPYSQYTSVTGILDIDGTKYVYDGYVALMI